MIKCTVKIINIVDKNKSANSFASIRADSPKADNRMNNHDKTRVIVAKTCRDLANVATKPVRVIVLDRHDLINLLND